MDLASFFQIAEMPVPRLNSEKTARWLCRADNHLGKGEDDADQYAVNRPKHQHSGRMHRQRSDIPCG